MTTETDDRLLALFDIDGTLMSRASEAHAEALHVAIEQVHGIDVRGARGAVGPRAISPAGRTDGEIARLLLLRAGVPAATIDARAADVRLACCAAYARLCPEDLSDRVVPGIGDLVQELAGRDDVRLSLVTGNFEPVARLKLARGGIGRHFASGQGGFGSDCEDRAALPGIARRRAGRDGVAHPRERTVIIGDTPRDIACARADGVGCIAVTTGPHAAAELTGADAIARDVTELREHVLAALDSPRSA